MGVKYILSLHPLQQDSKTEKQTYILIYWFSLSFGKLIDSEAKNKQYPNLTLDRVPNTNVLPINDGLLQNIFVNYRIKESITDFITTKLIPNYKLDDTTYLQYKNQIQNQ